VVSAGVNGQGGARRITRPGRKEDHMIDSVNMTDRGSSLLSEGTAIVRHRLSGGRLMCAGLVVTLVGVALGLMATYEVPAHWTTAVVGAAILLGGTLRRMLASQDGTEHGRQSR
jgi:hypothetical protein